jgi:DNA-directed RNA polymerase specialized sigma24 family protein
MQPPAHYEPYLDGLFTYCLAIVGEHDAACSAVGEVLALAERQRVRLRDPALRRPWLYALARWVCPRRLAAGVPVAPHTSKAAAESRRAELAALAWPEAAGTTPEQREALELAVRHQLPTTEVAQVLGLDEDAARTLLARAACEVERTRTALAVADTGRCPAVGRLAGEVRVLLGPVLRAELVRHVDECAVCRSTAESVVAGGPWPGTTTGAAAVLALVAAPRSAAYAALLHAMDTGVGRTREATPRFDRGGFPLAVRDRAARRAQLRNRAVTSTVVAAVVAAPVLALWAAYRTAPLDDDSPGLGRRTAASGPDGHQTAGGNHSSRHSRPMPSPAPATAPKATTLAVSPVAGLPAAHSAGAAHLTVTTRPTAAPTGPTTVTLTDTGTAPLRWSAATRAPWIRLSATSGRLRPGESTALTVSTDATREPSTPWTAQVTFSPYGPSLTLRGAPLYHRTAPQPTSPPGTPGKPPPSTTPAPASRGPAAPPAASPAPARSPHPAQAPAESAGDPTGSAPAEPAAS